MIDRLCCRKEWIFTVSWLLRLIEIQKADWLKRKENFGWLKKVQKDCRLEKCLCVIFFFYFLFFPEQGILFYMTVGNWIPTSSTIVSRVCSRTWVSCYMLSKWHSRWGIGVDMFSFLSEISSWGWETSHITTAVRFLVSAHDGFSQNHRKTYLLKLYSRAEGGGG